MGKNVFILSVNLRNIFQEVANGNDIRLIDLNIVRRNFLDLSKAFSFAKCHAAVKANTANGILELLKDNGSSFEIATREELELCLSKGIPAERIIF